mmetsp:Transcript_17567/g.16795  ORF Transcript_17567/g.16795 Transcript_17567/m.16795 type:complete len:94 (+) Transcript_17567:571-852(+)
MERFIRLCVEYFSCSKSDWLILAFPSRENIFILEILTLAVDNIVSLLEEDSVIGENLPLENCGFLSVQTHIWDCVVGILNSLSMKCLSLCRED